MPSTALGTKGTVVQAAQFLLARNFYVNWKDKHESNNHIKIYIVQTILRTNWEKEIKYGSKAGKRGNEIT